MRSPTSLAPKATPTKRVSSFCSSTAGDGKMGSVCLQDPISISRMDHLEDPLMRRSRGVLLPPVRAAGRLRRGDVYRAIRAAVLDGVLSPGERLPSTRQAGADYGVSRGMLEEVYAQLTEEGFIERAVGRGTFVAPTVERLSTPVNRKPGEPRVLRPSRRGQSAAANAACREPAVPIPFNAGTADTSEFPWMLLVDRGDAVWIEDPCYLGARAAFALAGAAIIPVPVDDKGIRADPRARRSSRAHLIYVTPSHQYPTGVALSLERRIALLELAVQNDSWVVEDDYDGEFRYEGQPLTALHSLDSHARVLYIGTLNKSMFVSLRLAYAVVPEELLEPLANIRTQLDGFTPAVQQMAMSVFMDEGHFSSHLRRMRAVYGAKRAALVEGLAPLAALGWTWSNNSAGMHLLVRHQRGDYVRAVAAASSLDLALLSTYRVARTTDDGLFLRFGALDRASLRAGVTALVAGAKKLSR
ncbi:MAG: PLP-dependent aminotransferase family protein [Acidobacteriia bacterium]|nr:PLP-dependent aminotransferase family protein [Terriglobia bacterium]